MSMPNGLDVRRRITPSPIDFASGGSRRHIPKRARVHNAPNGQTFAARYTPSCIRIQCSFDIGEMFVWRIVELLPESADATSSTRRRQAVRRASRHQPLILPTLCVRDLVAVDGCGY